jgi:hypothetical protein
MSVSSFNCVQYKLLLQQVQESRMAIFAVPKLKMFPARARQLPRAFG